MTPHTESHFITSAEATQRKIELFMRMSETKGIEGMPTLGEVVRTIGDAYFQSMRKQLGSSENKPTNGSGMKTEEATPLTCVLLVVGAPGVGKSYFVDNFIIPYLETITWIFLHYYGVANAGVDKIKWDDKEREYLDPLIKSGEIDINEPTKRDQLIEVGEYIEKEIKAWMEEHRNGRRMLVIEIPGGTTENSLRTPIDTTPILLDIRPHAMNIYSKLLNGQLGINPNNLFLGAFGFIGGITMQLYDFLRDVTVHAAANYKESNRLRKSFGLPLFASSEEFEEAKRSGTRDVIRRTSGVTGSGVWQLTDGKFESLPPFVQRILHGENLLALLPTDDSSQESLLAETAIAISQVTHENPNDILLQYAIQWVGILPMKRQLFDGERRAQIISIGENKPPLPIKFFE